MIIAARNKATLIKDKDVDSVKGGLIRDFPELKLFQRYLAYNAYTKSFVLKRPEKSSSDYLTRVRASCLPEDLHLEDAEKSFTAIVKQFPDSELKHITADILTLKISDAMIEHYNTTAAQQATDIKLPQNG